MIEFSKIWLKFLVSINVFNQKQEAGYGVECRVHRPLCLYKSSDFVVGKCSQCQNRGALKFPIKRTL